MNKIGITIIFIFMTSLLLACNDGVTESQHLAKAEEYSAKGDLNAASIELKNALQKKPDNPLIRLELGKLYLQAGNMPAAEKELTKALSFGAEDDLVLPYLGRSLLYQGKHAEVMQLPLENLKDKSKSEVLAQKGLSLVAQGEMVKARFMVDKAMSIPDKSVHAMVANALILGYNKDYKKSREQLDAVFKIDPNLAQAWSILGDIELNENNYDAALTAISKAISLRAFNMQDVLKRAVLYIQLKQYDKAQQDIDYLKDKIPLHPGFNYVQGIIHFQNKKFQDAQAAFDLALVDEKRYSMALYYAGLTSYILGQQGRAEKYTVQYFTKFPEFPPVRKLLALIKINNLKYAEAEELVRPLVEASTNDVGAMNILATALLKQGKTNESIELLSKIAELNPDSPEAQRRLGIGLMISGDDAAGEEHLAAAAKLDISEDSSGEILLILNYLRQKQFEKALKAAKAYKEKFPEKATSYNVLGRVYQLTDKQQEAVAAFKDALKVEPGNPSASQSLAAIAIKDKDYAKARNYYLQALKKHNNNLAILMKLAALDSLERNEKSMVNYLQQAIEAYPKAIQPRLVLARYYMAQGDNDQVVLLAGGLDQTQMKTPSVLELVSLAQLAKGDFRGARDTLEQFIQIQPNSPQAHHRLASAYGGMNKPKKMRAELEKSIELAPEYLPARFVMAKVLLASHELELAKKHIAALKERAPNNPEVIKIEATLALQEGKTDQALNLAESAYKIAPSTLNVLALSQMKWQLNDHAGAVQLCNNWLAQHPDDVQVRLSLAGSYLILDDTAKAIDQYKEVLTHSENNLVALNNLAWFLRDTDKRKALEYARRANSVQHQSPALMDTLAVVLFKNNEIDEAQRIIREAMDGAPKNPSIQYHGAMIFAAAGDKTAAVKILNGLTGDKIVFSEKDDARELLKKLQVDEK